jgi:predicted AAA+ superfamily ATPase
LVRLESEVPRRAREVAIRAAADFPVVLLQGPRSVGKSTLLHSLAGEWQRQVVDLDDLMTRQAIATEPALFIAQKGPVLIDEFQHVPEVLDAIKAELNRHSAPGRFVITGSTRYDSLPRAAQSLTGRIRRIDVLPLSLGEVDGVREHFVPNLLGGGDALLERRVSVTAREEYAERVTAGGFPLVLQLPTRAARTNWFETYIDLVVSRDVLELSQIRQRRQLPLLLNRLAAQTGSVVNVASAASAVGLDKTTAEDYLQLLEAVFLLRRMPAWGTTLSSRVNSSPKLHVVDSGIAARLLRLTPEQLLAATASALTEFGHLLETFVVGEIYKQVSWLENPVDVGHFRTRDGEEVDVVLENYDGSVWGFEVKASGQYKGAEKGMAALKRKVGGKFAGGVVFYLGQHIVRLGDDVVACPVDQLWQAEPSLNGP